PILQLLCVVESPELWADRREPQVIAEDANQISHVFKPRQHCLYESTLARFQGQVDEVESHRGYQHQSSGPVQGPAECKMAFPKQQGPGPYRVREFESKSGNHQRSKAYDQPPVDEQEVLVHTDHLRTVLMSQPAAN